MNTTINKIYILVFYVTPLQVFMYGSVQAAFQHGITAPLRRPRRDPPPPLVDEPQPRQRIEGRDHLAGGDAPQQAPRHRADDVRLQRNQVRQRQPNRPREKQTPVDVETLNPSFRGDEIDARRREGGPDPDKNLSADSDPESQQEAQEEPEGASASSASAANRAQTKTKATRSDSSKSEAKPSSQPAGRQPSHTDVQVSSCKIQEN